MGMDSQSFHMSTAAVPSRASCYIRVWCLRIKYVSCIAYTRLSDRKQWKLDFKSLVGLDSSSPERDELKVLFATFKHASCRSGTVRVTRFCKVLRCLSVDVVVVFCVMRFRVMQSGLWRNSGPRGPLRVMYVRTCAAKRHFPPTHTHMTTKGSARRRNSSIARTALHKAA
jgi:hypothetical protein